MGVAEKYGHLAPTVYDATPLGIFEHQYEAKNGGTNVIAAHLRQGVDIFAGRPDSVKEKYRYVFRKVLGNALGFDPDTKTEPKE